jgi:hypothetical protein
VVVAGWLGEIGPAPHQHFATAQRLASWATVCPGNYMSAKKSKGGRTGDGGNYIKHHPDRNNADPRAIDRFRRSTEACEYLSAHLKDNANGHSGPGPTAPPRADAGMPGEYSEAASRVLTMLEETWQAIRAAIPRSRPSSSSSPAAPPARTPDGAASTPSGGPSTPPAP